MKKKSLGKYSSLAKNTLLFSLSNIGSKIISFFLVPLYTYVLSSSEYGTVDLVSTISGLLISLLTVNVQDAVLRFTLDKEYPKEEIISIALKVNAVGVTILSVLLFAVKFSGLVNIDTSLYLFLFAVYLSVALNNSFNLYLKAQEKVSVIVVSGILNTLFMCLLNILFLLVFKMGMNGYMLAYALSSVLATLYLFFVGKIYKDFTLKTSKETMKKMLSYSLPLIMNPLMWWLNDASDRYILTFMCSVAVTGVYSVAYKIPTILNLVQSVFNNAWSISAIKEYDPEDSDGFAGNIYSLYSFLCVMACSAIMLVNKPLSAILYSNEFYEAWRYVPFLLVSGVFSGLKSFIGNIFIASKKVKLISVTAFAGATVNIICNFVLINFLGPVGAALATMLGYIVTFLTRCILLRKTAKLKVNIFVIAMSYCLLIVQSVVATKGDMLWLQILVFVALLLIQVKCIGPFLGLVKEKFLKKNERKE